MSIIGNILWFLLGGFLIGMMYILAGLLCCITIIGIPFGYALMKIGLFTFLPFGRTPEFKTNQPDALRLVFNILWILFGWWEITLTHVGIGILCCITIIGIPFGLQHFKIARLSLFPFGSTGK
ncbi:MAG: YccF domain-containing protein [Bacteroidia bacterium]|nr:YccF domain-containing protein [Bacteroidia bacterium]